MSGFATNGLPLATNALTGNELFAGDTQLAQGLAPESAAFSSSQLAVYAGNTANFRNLLIGGDFSTNPFQRGTSTASSISSTVTYQADRWFGVGGATSALIMQTTTNTTVPGFNTGLTVKRVSATTDTLAINVGQVLETADSLRAQGQTVCLSFWAAASANYSPANSALGVFIYSGTGTNQASSASLMQAGSLTNQQTCNSTALGVTGAISSVALSTTMQRFFVIGKVPTSATQLGVMFQMTPVATASGAPTLADSYQLMGVQLEITSANATQASAAAYASAFEHRATEVEVALCQRYFYQINEPSAGVVLGTGLAKTAAIGVLQVPLPVQMRVAPTVTTTIGNICVTNGAAAAQTVTTLAAIGTGAAGATVNSLSVSAFTSGTLTIGQGALLVGSGGTGLIAASAEF